MNTIEISPSQIGKEGWQMTDIIMKNMQELQALGQIKFSISLQTMHSRTDLTTK